MPVPSPSEYEEMLSTQKAPEDETEPAPANIETLKSRRDRAKKWVGGLALAAVLFGGPLAAQKLRDLLHHQPNSHPSITQPTTEKTLTP